MPRPSANDITQGTLPKISHGRGVYLWDADGRQYIDGSGGPAVFSIGHGDARVNAAVARQMDHFHQHDRVRNLVRKPGM